MRSYISGKTVVCSGSITFQKDEIPSIRPFEDDQAYAIEFKLNVSDGLATNISWKAEGSKSIVIEIALNIKTDGTEIAPSTPILVAEIDDNTMALMNLAIKILGTPERYTCFIHYTIYAQQVDHG